MGQVRCAIYGRTSLSNGKQTCENQLRELRQIAERRGYLIVAELVDEGVSGAKGRDQRPQFDTLIKEATRQSYDIILCWSVCRLGRSVQHLVSFLDEIHSVGCDLYIHQSGLDTSTPSGKMMFQMCGVFAEFERGMIRERVKAGQSRAKAQGKHIGRPSTIDAALVGSVLSMKAEGVGIKKMASHLQVGVGTIYKVLRNEDSNMSLEAA